MSVSVRSALALPACLVGTVEWDLTSWILAGSWIIGVIEHHSADLPRSVAWHHTHPRPKNRSKLSCKPELRAVIPLDYNLSNPGCKAGRLGLVNHKLLGVIQTLHSNSLKFYKSSSSPHHPLSEDSSSVDSFRSHHYCISSSSSPLGWFLKCWLFSESTRFYIYSSSSQVGWFFQCWLFSESTHCWGILPWPPFGTLQLKRYIQIVHTCTCILISHSVQWCDATSSDKLNYPWPELALIEIVRLGVCTVVIS